MAEEKKKFNFSTLVVVFVVHIYIFEISIPPKSRYAWADVTSPSRTNNTSSSERVKEKKKKWAKQRRATTTAATAEKKATSSSPLSWDPLFQCWAWEREKVLINRPLKRRRSLSWFVLTCRFRPHLPAPHVCCVRWCFFVKFSEILSAVQQENKEVVDYFFRHDRSDESTTHKNHLQ